MSQKNGGFYHELRRTWKEAYPLKKKGANEKEFLQWWCIHKQNEDLIIKKLAHLKNLKLSRTNAIAKAFAKKGLSTESESTTSNSQLSPHVQSSAARDVSINSGQVNAVEENVLLSNTPETPVQNLLIELLQKETNQLLILKNAMNSGLDLSDEQRKRFNELKKSTKLTAAKLKRRQQTQAANLKYRKRKKGQLKALQEKHPELAEDINQLLPQVVGRPRVERDQPELLDTIISLVTHDSSADERRRSDQLRTIKSLDVLLFELRNLGFNISRSGLYLRLMPRDSNTTQGKRHVITAPVKLVRAQNDARKPHPDTHFAAATVRYLKDLAGMFGNANVCVISQDDKARVPLGLPAAKKQSPILMKMDYRVRLPDHDWVVGTKHKLIPSVYAALEIKEGQVSYSGPTYIGIRSGKHDSSTAMSHAIDMERLENLDIFKPFCKTLDNQFKPIWIILSDGGPDENPRFPKTLKYASLHFKRLNLDALFVATHAPHQSASNPVERRMAPLSSDLCGLILPYESFGSHLDGNGQTKDIELEKQNFQKAGEILAEIWSTRVIDGFEVFAEYVTQAGGADSIDDDGADSTLRSLPEVGGPNNLYKPIASKEPQFLTESWKQDHVRQSQYCLQIVKCGNIHCCSPAKTNVRQFLGDQFIPAPVKVKMSNSGLKICSVTDDAGRFFNLTTRLSIEFLLSRRMTCFDTYCPSIQDKISERTCNSCKSYFTSKSAVIRHKQVHRRFVDILHYQQEVEEVDPELVVEEAVGSVIDDSIHIIHDLKEWIEIPFMTKDD